eukprot:TRINITY_DN579_c0_g1_i1.p1 TRINITY_DN579_c0_g1~~TRINITY_DN579_c0_g1_i1.p1  ORF type:complete len:147 (+),score=51.72 TRINITY_DN579_c0_g1_i1:372-812(+)
MGEPVDIQTLSLEQLTMLSKQLEEDAEYLQNAVNTLRMAQHRFEDSGDAVKQLEGTAGKEVIFPLSSSLVFVKGKMAQDQNILVDIGQGFYVERSIDDAMAYTKRKVDEIEENISQLEENLSDKRRAVTSVQMILQAKVMAMYGQR